MSIRVQKCADERPAFKGRVIQSHFTFDNLFIIQSFISRLYSIYLENILPISVLK